jgi:hypothetical protein
VKPYPYKRTRSVEAYAKYRVGMTVQEAIEAGVPRDWILWDRRYGYITVE